MTETKDNDQTSNRPLVMRMGALGDMVMLTPLLRGLYERTGQKIDLAACGEWNRQIFADCPWINKIYTVTSRNAPYWFNKSKQQLVRELRPTAPGRPWIIMEHLPTLYRLMKRAKFSPTHKINPAEFPRAIGEHSCQQHLRLINADFSCLPALAQPITNLNTELHISDQEISACKAWLNRKGIPPSANIILIQAGNKKTMRKGKRNRASNIKYWPENNWSKLILRLLAKDPNNYLLLCGAPSEKGLCDEIIALCQQHAPSDRLMQVANDLPLRRLMALTTLAHSCISVDTGPAHIAAAFGCPLVVLFGKSDPRQFRPIGPGEVKIAAKMDWQTFTDSPEQWAKHNTMEDITIDQVEGLWASLRARH